MRNTIRIGCASAFWGDTQTAASQLVHFGQIDYLVFDYLAEITMSILAAARRKHPEHGYALDFVTAAMAPVLQEIRNRGIRVVSNAGGINPMACRAALEAAARQAGVELRVAVVLGDDLLDRRADLVARGTRSLDTGEALPDRILSVNAYLGAAPIAEALAAGADIVITGRVVDSAIVLGPLIHEFGWPLDDYDRLAQGSLAGHLLECGTQCTGGNFTDWERVPGYENMGFPIAECSLDGGFVVTKPAGTGGLVTPATVAEQLVYEIGDPRDYLLPDVVCDFSQVRLEQQDTDRVRVSGARGRAPTGDYKACATVPEGYRCSVAFLLAGIDAAAKGQRVAEALIARSAGLLARLRLGAFDTTSVEILGAEATYGPRARAGATREVVVKLAVSHPDKQALQVFAREIAQAATAMAPGITGVFGGRPKVSPRILLYSCLVPKSFVEASVEVADSVIDVSVPLADGYAPPGVEPVAPALPALPAAESSMPLIALAWARSGDKGDHCNIGVIARRPEYLPYIRGALTEESVAAFMRHVLDPDRGRVRRYDLPGLSALNFVLEHSLGGGGMASLRADPQGKAFAQQLLEFPVPVPDSLIH